MSFLELAKKRYSVRKYESKSVEEEMLLKILEAGRIAPTAANFQPQRLIVVQKEDGLTKLKKSADIKGAPLAIIICSDHNTSWKRRYDDKDTADIDASIVTTHMMLQATELGLGSVWICHFEPTILREEFKLPDNLEPINILALGYSSPEADASENASPNRHDTKRKPLSETVFFETL